MKRFYIGINIFLVLAIAISLFVKPTEKNFSVKPLTRSITTSKLIQVNEKNEEKKVEKVKAEEEEPVSEITESVTKIENDMSGSIANASIISDVLETQTGTMSSYGPDCAGCSGYLATGFDARTSITYQDPTYGTVRIVAGDRKYPFGTIVRVKGVGPDFNVIVLDRGGDIGIGRRFMFDLLCPSESEASSFGTNYNLTFEILRYGY